MQFEVFYYPMEAMEHTPLVLLALVGWLGWIYIVDGGPVILIIITFSSSGCKFVALLFEHTCWLATAETDFKDIISNRHINFSPLLVQQQQLEQQQQQHSIIWSQGPQHLRSVDVILAL